MNLAQGSKRTWTISFKKKQKIGDVTKKIEVRSAGDHDHEMKMKSIADADFENIEGGDACRENAENNEGKIMSVIILLCNLDK